MDGFSRPVSRVSASELLHSSPLGPVPPEAKYDSDDEGSVVDLEDSELAELDELGEEDEDAEFSDVEFEGELDSHGRFAPTHARGLPLTPPLAASQGSGAIPSLVPSVPSLPMGVLRLVQQSQSCPISSTLLRLHSLFIRQQLRLESLSTLGSTLNTTSGSEPSQPHLSLLSFPFRGEFVSYVVRCDSLVDLLSLQYLQMSLHRLSQSDMDRACEGATSCLPVLVGLGLSPSL